MTPKTINASMYAVACMSNTASIKSGWTHPCVQRCVSTCHTHVDIYVCNRWGCIFVFKPEKGNPHHLTVRAGLSRLSLFPGSVDLRVANINDAKSAVSRSTPTAAFIRYVLTAWQEIGTAVDADLSVLFSGCAWKVWVPSMVLVPSMIWFCFRNIDLYLGGVGPLNSKVALARKYFKLSIAVDCNVPAAAAAAAANQQQQYEYNSVWVCCFTHAKVGTRRGREPCGGFRRGPRHAAPLCPLRQGKPSTAGEAKTHDRCAPSEKLTNPVRQRHTRPLRHSGPGQGTTRMLLTQVQQVM